MIRPHPIGAHDIETVAAGAGTRVASLFSSLTASPLPNLLSGLRSIQLVVAIVCAEFVRPLDVQFQSSFRRSGAA
ncbi:hypothetical protein ACF3M1_15210 [Luteimonas sp. WGS1318]|uniref:hypothetical protein n=1 Tax=Luteimonas sp. WGS1318 TaxID=3366815 RepID=UPI00372CED05